MRVWYSTAEDKWLMAAILSVGDGFACIRTAEGQVRKFFDLNSSFSNGVGTICSTRRGQRL